MNTGKTSRFLASLLILAIGFLGHLPTALAEPGDEVISTLADGSPEARLVFDTAGAKTVYLRVPSGWAPPAVSIDLEGGSYTGEVVDQKNDTARYEGAYSVRAQQFRPGARSLAGIEILLARTTQGPNGFTIEIRPDDGTGLPSASVLASATKAIAPGAYRWERFGFPAIAVEPGLPYWIVGYVVSPDKVSYPSQPSLGDYGYFVGLSSGDEYPNGDSADLLTTPTGPQWERFPARKAWDLMFRTIASRGYFPTSPALRLGNDGQVEWQRQGEFNGPKVTVDLTTPVSRYLLLNTKTGGAGDTDIPISVSSDSPGAIRLSGIKIVKQAETPLAPSFYGPQPADSPTASPTGAGDIQAITPGPLNGEGFPTPQPTALSAPAPTPNATPGLLSSPTSPPAVVSTPEELYSTTVGMQASPVPLPTPGSTPALPYGPTIQATASATPLPTMIGTPAPSAASAAQPTAMAGPTGLPSPGFEPQGTPVPQPTRVSGQITAGYPAPKPLGPAGPRFVPPSDISLKSLGFGDTTISGVDVVKDFFLPGAGGYALADGSYLKLVFSHSGILLEDRSTMTVQLNGAPVATVRLNRDNANLSELKVSLPKEKLLDSFNQIRIKLYMRILDGACTDELNNPALNTTIYGESLLHYEYASLVRKPPLTPPTLADYPEPFVYPTYSWPDEFFFVVPDDPSSAELTSAASIAAKLGQLAGGKVITPTVAAASQLDPERREGYDLIFVGKAESLGLSPELKEKAFLEIVQNPSGGSASLRLSGEDLSDDSGFIRLVNSPWNPAHWVLIVSGTTDLAVQRAGTILSSKTFLGTLKGDQVVVTQDPHPGALLADYDPTLPTEVTLGQMGTSDLLVSGLGELVASTIPFSSPPPNPDDGAYIDVVLSHSPLVVRTESSLRIELNGLPIRSIQLDDDSILPQRVRVDLPHSVLRPGPNSLTFRLTLYGQVAEACGAVDRSRNWAIVHAESVIHLPPAGPEPTLSLGLFPHPFLGPGPRLETGYLERNVLVLPNDPAEWRDFLQLVVALGKYVTADVIDFPTVLARNLPERTREEKNVILYGTWGALESLAGGATTLPLQLAGGQVKTFRVPAGETVSIRDKMALGLVQTIPSPWNAVKALLVVSGNSGETLPWASSALGSGRLAGNLSTVTRKDKLTTFYGEHLRWPW
ncbi:MAG: cellulose biosynthesis cyclic di-GMP-binding regulatory protein BcsB [Dehalococcoidia bacterium]|nr:cellulose biosynthesis cyclic di-GMP-binding regulatory protein BcsB [Dehalococcoidia bacterium]